jgi:hypothetical protein
MPFLNVLLKKMSANEVAMMQRMPKSSRAHGACSLCAVFYGMSKTSADSAHLDEPQPKLGPPTTRIFALRYGS